jgi:Flp pilus assembly protein TadD
MSRQQLGWKKLWKQTTVYCAKDTPGGCGLQLLAKRVLTLPVTTRSAELINVASTVNYMVLALRDGSPSSAVMRVRELCQEALQKFPNDVALLVNCGSTLEREGFPDEAESLYTQALDIDPNRPELLNNIGWLLENKGGDFLLQAKEYYERAAELLLPATHPQIETNRQNIEEKLQALPLFRPPFLHAEQRHGLGLPLLPAM